MCAKCQSPEGKFRCTRCKSINYCSQNCQILHWPEHSRGCHPNHFRDDPRPEGRSVYVYSYRIFSKDPDHPNYRAGVLGTFFEREGQLYGITTYQIFNKTWTGGASGDKEENVIGKRATTLRWKDLPNRKDAFTDPNLIEIGREIGEVVKVKGPLVLLKIHDWVREDVHFQQEGKWCGVAKDVVILE